MGKHGVERSRSEQGFIAAAPAAAVDVQEQRRWRFRFCLPEIEHIAFMRPIFQIAESGQRFGRPSRLVGFRTDDGKLKANDQEQVYARLKRRPAVWSGFSK